MRRPFAQPRSTITGSSYSAGIVFSLASFAAIGIITLLTSVLSARLYGISVIGQAALALAPVAIVTLLSTVREQPAMVRELAKLEPGHPRATGLFLAVFAFSFALTLVVTVLGLVGCYFTFRGPLHHPGLLAPAAVGLVGYLLIINTCWNLDGVFGAFRAGRELFAVRLHQAVVYGALLTALVTIMPTVWGLVLAFLGSWLTALVHRLALMRRVICWRVPVAELRAGFASLREIVTFGLKLTPGSLAVGLSEASGTWILAVTSSIDAVGSYSRAWSLASRLTELNWRITEMLLPTLVQHRHAGDQARFARVLTDSLRYAAFGLLLPASVGGGAAEAIMTIFGAGFGTAAGALRILLFVPLLQTLTAIQGTALMAYDRPLLTAFAQGVRLVVTIAAGVTLAAGLGVTGMALAMAAGAFAGFGICLIVLRVRIARPPLAKPHYRQLGGLIAAYVGGLLTSHALEHAVPGSAGLLLALAGGSFAYVAIGVGVAGTTHHDRARLQNALARLTRRHITLLKSPGTA